MTKLKTLKDVWVGIASGIEFELKQKLRQEAIKWLKENKKNAPNDLHIIELDDWLEFFNITEEDLR